MVLYISSHPLHFVFPATVGTIALITLLCLFWVISYIILIGKTPLSKELVEAYRLNLATVRSITGLSWFIAPLFNRLEERERIRSKRQQRDEADKIIDDYVEILTEDFNINLNLDGWSREKVREEIVEDTEQTKVGAYPIITPSLLEEYPSEIQHGLEALIFAYEIEYLQSKGERQDFTGEQTSDFNQGVKNSVNIFEFGNPGKSEENFLILYNNLREKVRDEVTLEYQNEDNSDGLIPRTDSTLSNSRAVELYREFMVNYYPSEAWVKYAEDEYVEYKNKIVELVQAQISVGGVQSDVFGILEEERQRIRDQLNAQEAYLICSKQIENYENSLQYDVLPEKYPRSIRIGNKYLDEPGRDEEPLEIKMRIVFPRRTYGSTSNFIEKSLSDIIPSEEIIFVSKLTTPFEHRRSQEEIFNMAEDEEKVNYILTKTDFLLRGRSEEEITRAAIDNLRMTEIDVSELLKSLTLRSLVDFATYEEEKFFSEHKEKIEDGLNINSIFGWGDQDPEVIGELLKRWDEEEVSKRWERISKEYISQIQTATPPTHFDDLTLGTSV